MLIFRFGHFKIVAPSQTPGMSAAKGIEPQRQTYMETSLAFLPGHQSAHLV